MRTQQRAGRFEDQTYDYIVKQTGNYAPSIGIILGTGLGGLVKNLDAKYKIDYRSIPHFPVSTVESHHGNLIFGNIAGKQAVIMQGRFHYYEGYSYRQITYPVKIMKRLGINTLLVSNACGGLNPVYRKSDLMIMRDHINFHFDTPLRGIKMKSANKSPYDKDLISLAEKTAIENKINIRKGVYLSLHGPCLETRSEYRMVRMFGADVVGMSTIPEALAACNLSIRTLGLSIITDMGLPDTLKPAMISEILEAASIAEPKLTMLTEKIIQRLN